MSSYLPLAAREVHIALIMANRIRTFIPPKDLKELPFDKENLIVSFGLYNLCSEDAW